MTSGCRSSCSLWFALVLAPLAFRARKRARLSHQLRLARRRCLSRYLVACCTLLLASSCSVREPTRVPCCSCSPRCTPAVTRTIHAQAILMQGDHTLHQNTVDRTLALRRSHNTPTRWRLHTRTRTNPMTPTSHSRMNSALKLPASLRLRHPLQSRPCGLARPARRVRRRAPASSAACQTSRACRHGTHTGDVRHAPTPLPSSSSSHRLLRFSLPGSLIVYNRSPART